MFRDIVEQQRQKQEERRSYSSVRDLPNNQRLTIKQSFLPPSSQATQNAQRLSQLPSHLRDSTPSINRSAYLEQAENIESQNEAQEISQQQSPLYPVPEETIRQHGFHGDQSVGVSSAGLSKIEFDKQAFMENLAQQQDQVTASRGNISLRKEVYLRKGPRYSLTKIGHDATYGGRMPRPIKENARRYANEWVKEKKVDSAMAAHECSISNFKANSKLPGDVPPPRAPLFQRQQTVFLPSDAVDRMENVHKPKIHQPVGFMHQRPSLPLIDRNREYPPDFNEASLHALNARRMPTVRSTFNDNIGGIQRRQFLYDGIQMDTFRQPLRPGIIEEREREEPGEIYYEGENEGWNGGENREMIREGEHESTQFDQNNVDGSDHQGLQSYNPRGSVSMQDREYRDENNETNVPSYENNNFAARDWRNIIMRDPNYADEVHNRADMEAHDVGFDQTRIRDVQLRQPREYTQHEERDMGESVVELGSSIKKSYPRGNMKVEKRLTKTELEGNNTTDIPAIEKGRTKSIYRGQTISHRKEQWEDQGHIQTLEHQPTIRNPTKRGGQTIKELEVINGEFNELGTSIERHTTASTRRGMSQGEHAVTDRGESMNELEQRDSHAGLGSNIRGKIRQQEHEYKDVTYNDVSGYDATLQNNQQTRSRTSRLVNNDPIEQRPEYKLGDFQSAQQSGDRRIRHRNPRDLGTSWVPNIDINTRQENAKYMTLKPQMDRLKPMATDVLEYNPEADVIQKRNTKLRTRNSGRKEIESRDRVLPHHDLEAFKENGPPSLGSSVPSTPAKYRQKSQKSVDPYRSALSTPMRNNNTEVELIQKYLNLPKPF